MTGNSSSKQFMALEHQQTTTNKESPNKPPSKKNISQQLFNSVLPNDKRTREKTNRKQSNFFLYTYIYISLIFQWPFPFNLDNYMPETTKTKGSCLSAYLSCQNIVLLVSTDVTHFIVLYQNAEKSTIASIQATAVPKQRCKKYKKLFKLIQGLY